MAMIRLARRAGSKRARRCLLVLFLACWFSCWFADVALFACILFVCRSYDILLCWNNEGGFLERGAKPVRFQCPCSPHRFTRHRSPPASALRLAVSPLPAAAATATALCGYDEPPPAAHTVPPVLVACVLGTP
jgi:hypothetical protein